MKARLIETIKQIRKEENPDVADNKTHRHCIDIREKDAMVSYLFSIPVRQEEDGALIDSHWEKRGSVWEAKGAMLDTLIRVTKDRIILSRPRKSYTLALPYKQCWKEKDNELYSADMRIGLNPSGVSVACSIEDRLVMRIETNDHIYGIKGNSRYFAFMSQRFKPSATLSALYFQGEDNTLYPVKLSYDEVNANTYDIELDCPVKSHGTLLLEYNLYEDKLFQDTTVSQMLSQENNVFGSVAFLGSSDVFGEERLYIKPVFDMLNQYRFCDIQSIRLMIPKIAENCPEIKAYRMDDRFCSFGSTWNNKVPHSRYCIPVTQSISHIILDLTEYMVENGRLKFFYGILLKSVEKTMSYGVVATGDCSSFPIILEVKYKR